MPTLAKLYYFSRGVTPIDIKENSGNNLTNYQVMIQLTSSWDGWSRVSSDGSDIYFIDPSGNPLYFWIEKFDYANKNAIIWVKIPSIPANGIVRIYLRFGVLPNPYSSYRNGDNVFIFFDDFLGTQLDTTKWTVVITTGGSFSISNGILTISVVSDGSNWKFVGIKSNTIFNGYHEVIAKVKWTYTSEHQSFILDKYSDESNFQGIGYLGYYDTYRLRALINGSMYDTNYSLSNDNPANYEWWKIAYDTDGYAKIYRSTDRLTWTLLASRNSNIFTSNFNVGIRDDVKGSSTSYFYVDYVFAKQKVSQEPSITINPSVAPKLLDLM